MNIRGVKTNSDAMLSDNNIQAKLRHHFHNVSLN